MELILQHGRPLDETGRLTKEMRTYDLLDKLGIVYERVDHEPAETMEALPLMKFLPRQLSAKTYSFAIRRKRSFIY